jgi:hypothetical protein
MTIPLLTATPFADRCGVPALNQLKVLFLGFVIPKGFRDVPPRSPAWPATAPGTRAAWDPKSCGHPLVRRCGHDKLCMARQKQSGGSALKAGLLCDPIVIDLSEGAAKTLWNDGEVGHDCFDLGVVTPAKPESQ